MGIADLARLRGDELAQIVQRLDHDPDLAALDLSGRLAVLELMLALASWRSQPIEQRAEALRDACDACLARPGLQRQRQAGGLDVPEVQSGGSVVRHSWSGSPVGSL